MNTNLVSLKIEFKAESRFISFHPQRKEDAYANWFVISFDEIPLVIDCIMGKSKYYPYFEDGNHKIKFVPSGFEVLEYTSTNHPGLFYQSIKYEFPFFKMGELLILINKFSQEPFDYEITYGEEWFNRLGFENRNRVTWLYQDCTNGKWEGMEYKEWVEVDIKQRVLSDAKINPGLLNQLKRLQRVALSYSNDVMDRVFIHFSLDDSYYAKNHPDIPTSYYFCIMTKDKKRLMNGGIIAHHDYRDYDNIAKIEYSMHT